MKSEEIPASNDGPVIVAVGKNFDEVVTNSGKDTLIEFYAPWCKIFLFLFFGFKFNSNNFTTLGGHCKKLAPIFDELGEKLKGEDVAIVKMDATANDVPPQFDVKGFPTLFWLPKNKGGSPIRYEGGRELDDFVNYISKHATSELKSLDRSGKPKKTEL